MQIFQDLGQLLNFSLNKVLKGFVVDGFLFY